MTTRVDITFFAILVIAGGFLLLAAVLAATALVASRGRKIHWGKILIGSLAMLWLVPIAGIVAVVFLYRMSEMTREHQVYVRSNLPPQIVQKMDSPSSQNQPVGSPPAATPVPGKLPAQ